MTASPQALLEVKNLSIEFLHRKGNLQAIHELTLSMQPERSSVWSASRARGNP